MQIGPVEFAILQEVARQRNVPAEALLEAIEHESVEGLTKALGLAPADAAARMARIRRAVAIDDDWGAGCKLLTDDVRAELHAALRAL